MRRVLLAIAGLALFAMSATARVVPDRIAHPEWST